MLRTDIDPATLQAKNIRQKLMAQVLREGIDIDPEAAPVMIRTLLDYIMTFDNCDDDFDDLAEYMPYRILNCGYM